MQASTCVRRVGIRNAQSNTKLNTVNFVQMYNSLFNIPSNLLKSYFHITLIHLLLVTSDIELVTYYFDIA